MLLVIKGLPVATHKSKIHYLNPKEQKVKMMAPELNLRMKTACLEHERIPEYDMAVDALEAMISKDDSNSYRCRDYLGRRRVQSKSVSEDPTVKNPDDTIDETCREKMVEWCYKISDHFSISREICAFSFSILDRFIDKCSCDRTAFKLAAMTSMYIATKIFNGKQLSISSLAQLSRGEFLSSHIGHMERIILDALNYRVNPPTVQAFIQQIRIFYPIMDGRIANEVYQRALFFSELCVFEYSFVTESKYSLAVACIVNAIEVLEDPFIAKHLVDEFLAALTSSICVSICSDALEKMKSRIWSLYSCSTQGHCDELQSAQYNSEHNSAKYDDEASIDHACSPVSVVSRNKVGYSNAMIFNPL